MGSTFPLAPGEDPPLRPGTQLPASLCPEALCLGSVCPTSSSYTCPRLNSLPPLPCPAQVSHMAGRAPCPPMESMQKPLASLTPHSLHCPYDFLT